MELGDRAGPQEQRGTVVSSEQTMTAVAAPGPDAGRPKQARDVRTGWWVYVADRAGVARWRLVVDVKFPPNTGSGLRRQVVTSDGADIPEMAAREHVIALYGPALRRLGLNKVDPRTLA